VIKKHSSSSVPVSRILHREFYGLLLMYTSRLKNLPASSHIIYIIVHVLLHNVGSKSLKSVEIMHKAT
jgi:hypothetical protein